MPKIPDSTKASLHHRLIDRARQRWPQLSQIRMRYRAGFAYIDGVLADGEVLRLCRLRYAGSARTGASRSTEPATTTTKTRSCPPDFMGGSPEDALDTACGLYLADPTAWT